MELIDLLKYLVCVLDDLGLKYFVTGSTATIFYGEPRFTNDIDVVVDLSDLQVADFCRRFPDSEFYLSESAAREAVRRKTQFNIIHPSSGLKVDCIVPEASPFNRSRFERSKVVRPAEDFEARFTSPEDAIIKKLDFYRQGSSEKHLRDIAGILKISRDQLDLAYITGWTQQMGLGELWSAVRKQLDQKT
jgi:hypothetical protein